MAKGGHFWEHPRNAAFGGIPYNYDWRSTPPLPGTAGGKKKKGKTQKDSAPEEQEADPGWPSPSYPNQGLPNAPAGFAAPVAQQNPGWNAPTVQSWGQPLRAPTGPSNAWGTPDPGQPSAMYQSVFSERGGASGINGSYGIDRSRVNKSDITTSPGWQRLRQDRERSA